MAGQADNTAPSTTDASQLCSRGRSPRARRPRQRQAAAATVETRQPIDSGATERFVFIQCQHCPQNGDSTQCFQRIQLTTADWNRLRHLQARNPTNIKPVAQATPTVKEPTAAAGPTVVNIPQPMAQPNPQHNIVQHQLLPPPVGRGRGAMLLRLLNQHRLQHPPDGVQFPAPGFGQPIGRGRALINMPMHIHPPAAAQAPAAMNMPPLNQPMDTPATEQWDDDDVIIL